MTDTTDRDNGKTGWRRPVKFAFLAMAMMTIVIVPFLLFGATLEAWTRGLMEHSRSEPFIAIVGALLLAADVVLPVPSTTISAGLGALLGAPIGILVTVVGLSLGCGLGYGLGRYLGRDFAERELGRTDFGHLSSLLERHGTIFLAMCRPVPVLAETSVIAAGVLGMRSSTVFVVTSLANLGFACVYAGIGAAAKGPSGFIAAFAASLAIPGLALLAARCLRESSRGQMS